jgi:hypothetical protein
MWSNSAREASLPGGYPGALMRKKPPNPDYSQVE